MAAGFRVVVNGHSFATVEALYQACRFPKAPDVQKSIIEQSSPMTAKMVSRQHLLESRSDWDTVKVRMMRWCLQVKLAQNIETFGKLLKDTGTLPIVEISFRDQFWGANPEGQSLRGSNVLGRLLMELRDSFVSDQPSILTVQPPRVDNFMLFGTEIGILTSDDKPPEISSSHQMKLAFDR